jgi:hypothetical protein
MPDITLTLTEQEYDDLETVAGERQQTPEECGHDLLVDAVAAELEQTDQSTRKVDPNAPVFGRLIAGSIG